MAQHYLHSKESRNAARFIQSLNESESESWLALLRWGSHTEQGCRMCGSFRAHYRRRHRRTWHCAECDHEFSVKSGTALHGTKLTYRLIVELIFAFENGAKGQSLLEMSRRIGATPKSIQVFFGKIREWMVHAMDLTPLQGIVHIDGGYFCGKPRPPRQKIKMPADALKVRFGKKPPTHPDKPWIDAGMTRQNWLKRANKRVVVALCESAGNREGSKRSIAMVCPAEDTATALQLVRSFVSPDAIVMTDESSAYASIGALVKGHFTVQHAREFATAEGVSDNMAETFYSRMRRAEYGTTHGYRPKYLQDIVCEMVWRENHRKTDQSERLRLLLTGMLHAPKSRWWTGYWQSKNRAGELGMNYFMKKS